MIESIQITVTQPRKYDNVEVCLVKVGEKTIGTLYKLIDEDSWFVYGYLDKPDTFGRKGYLRDILGEHPHQNIMATRLLMYKGYIPSTNVVGLEGSGVIKQ